MTKENIKLEKEKEPQKLELESDAGVLRFIEQTRNEGTAIHRDTVIEIENKQGKKFVINDLLEDLPGEWTIEDAMRNTSMDPDKPVIYINTHDTKQEGWQYILSILHEVGHAVIKESEPEQKELYEQFNTIRNETFRQDLKNNPDTMEQLNKIHSKMERDAWAYAIRQFKKILDELDMDVSNIFDSNQEIRDYVNELLLSYKEWGRKDIKNMHIAEEEQQKLYKQIDKMYTKKEVTRNK